MYDVDVDGNPVEEEAIKGRPKKTFDSELFRKLWHDYNRLDSKGKRYISKGKFARELGITYNTLDRILKEFQRDGRLDEQFKDNAVMQLRKPEKFDTPQDVLARMGIMQ